MSFDPVSFAMGKAAGGGGGGGTHIDPEADVRFFDSYDGSVVASYSAEDFANLTELPANPTHEGLTSQGWNWTLADAKAQVAFGGFLDIGQMYITDDDCTRVYVKIVANRSPIIRPYLSGTNASVTIDWGDGSTPDTYTGSNTYKEATHTYAADGNYVVSIKVNSGKLQIEGNSSDYGSFIFTANVNYVTYNRKYLNDVYRIEIGKDVILYNRALSRLARLEGVTIPRGCTITGTYVFYDSCLKHLTIPDDITTIPGYFLQNDATLESISIPKSITTIKTYPFRYCGMLERVCVPNGVTTVNGNLFTDTSGIKRLTIPNTLSTIPTYYAGSPILLRYLEIPENVTQIGSTAFAGSAAVEKIKLPAGLTTIGASGLANFYGMREINLPSTLTTIGNNGLDGCNSLPRIEIPASVTSIGNAAFKNSGFGEIKFLGSTPPTVGSNAFQNLPTGCKILVPAGSLSAYTGTTNMPSSSTYTYEEY